MDAVTIVWLIFAPRGYGANGKGLRRVRVSISLRLGMGRAIAAAECNRAFRSISFNWIAGFEYQDSQRARFRFSDSCGDMAHSPLSSCTGQGLGCRGE